MMFLNWSVEEFGTMDIICVCVCLIFKLSDCLHFMSY